MHQSALRNEPLGGFQGGQLSVSFAEENALNWLHGHQVPRYYAHWQGSDVEYRHSIIWRRGTRR